MRFRQIGIAWALCCAVVAIVHAAAQSQPYGAPLTREQEHALKPGQNFQECADCPVMVVVPTGSFTMGSPVWEHGRLDNEGPQHVVRFRWQFAVGKYHVTVDQYAAFVRETRHEENPRCDKLPGFVQEGSQGLHPVVCVSWDDSQAYLEWLSRKTGKTYRLLSEAEYEYAARGRTSPGDYPRFWFGDNDLYFCQYGNVGDQQFRRAYPGARAPTFVSCDDGYAYTSPVGSFRPNPFGLYDMTGNANQWMEDCWHGDYDGAPSDGSPWVTDCEPNSYYRVYRGSSWNWMQSDILRVAYRRAGGRNGAVGMVGFRVARELLPPPVTPSQPR